MENFKVEDTEFKDNGSDENYEVPDNKNIGKMFEDDFDNRLFEGQWQDNSDISKEIEPEKPMDFDKIFKKMFEGDSDIEPSQGVAEDQGDMNETCELPDEEKIDVSQMTEEQKNAKMQEYAEGKISFDEVKEIYAEYYADAVNSNRPWSWGENIPNGDMLTAGQKSKIIKCAAEKGLVPVVETRNENGKTYADFSKYKVFECKLPEDKWKEGDQEQFAECNKQLKDAIENDPELRDKFSEEQIAQIENGKRPSGYTWHHSEKDGQMELVPFGVHNSTYHSGGRSEGNWADSPRQ